jgi:hypothetical protein
MKLQHGLMFLPTPLHLNTVKIHLGDKFEYAVAVFLQKKLVLQGWRLFCNQVPTAMHEGWTFTQAQDNISTSINRVFFQ